MGRKKGKKPGVETETSGMRSFQRDQGQLAGYYNGVDPEKHDLISEKIEWLPVVRCTIGNVQRRISRWTVGEVMDLGTGPGVLVAEYLKQAFPSAVLVGMDLAGDTVQRKVAAEILDEGYEGDIAGIVDRNPDLAARFSVITALGVFDFIPPAALSENIAVIGRLLKKGGVVGITIEPLGTENKGVRSNQHDLRALTEAFAQHGIGEVWVDKRSYKAWGLAKERGQDEIEVWAVVGVKQSDDSPMCG